MKYRNQLNTLNIWVLTSLSRLARLLSALPGKPSLLLTRWTMVMMTRWTMVMMIRWTMVMMTKWTRVMMGDYFYNVGSIVVRAMMNAESSCNAISVTLHLFRKITLKDLSLSLS